MARVDAENVSKLYGSVTALDGVTIHFENGEFFGLLGPSGSGKTTLLRMIAGFIDPDTGSIAFDGERIDTVPVHRRGIGMVFQSYALFPHMTVEDNIAFGLDVRGTPKSEIAPKVEAMLDLVQLKGFGARKPRQLSGGQQQRVALARALITQPRVLLLDEPLGALDRRLRQEMQVELKEIQRRIGITTIFVTHDQEEALTLSDRIAIIDRGKLMQIGKPEAVYERPESIFAARFLGDANVFSGTVADGGLRLASGELIRAVGGKTATAVVRPEKMDIAPTGAAVADDRNRIEGTVMQTVFSGASVTYRIRTAALGAEPLLVFTPNRSVAPMAKGTSVTVSWSPADTVAVTG
ncbi:MAG: ABC transporter ATP-binding protein [Hyphomicrobiaceae bacterium]